MQTFSVFISFCTVIVHDCHNWKKIAVMAISSDSWKMAWGRNGGGGYKNHESWSLPLVWYAFHILLPGACEQHMLCNVQFRYSIWLNFFVSL